MPQLAPSGLHLLSVAGANVVDGRCIFTGDFQQLDRAVSENNSSSWAFGPSPLRLASWSEVPYMFIRIGSTLPTLEQVFSMHSGWVFPEVLYS